MSYMFLSFTPGPDVVYIVCYSLILLSVDLTSPCIKNKMSKREFIRNLRRATTGLDSETLGHMYDNVYLCGHVATQYCLLFLSNIAIFVIIIFKIFE